MTDSSDRMLGILTEMRDLLRLMAEPAIAERDKKMRVVLRGIAGNATGKKAKAIMLMDGARTRQEIIRSSGIDQGDLSALIKKLNTAELMSGDTKQPQLAISIPPTFFEKGDGSE